MRDVIQGLRNPTGATAFYDSVVIALSALEVAARTTHNGTNWIVALTDGEDNRSKIACDRLAANLQSSAFLDGLIIIAVGEGVEKEALQSLCSSTSKGVFVFAEGSKQSIADAFAQVAQLIQGQVVLEDF